MASQFSTPILSFLSEKLRLAEDFRTPAAIEIVEGFDRLPCE
jgi:hypothetical protein